MAYNQDDAYGRRLADTAKFTTNAMTFVKKSGITDMNVLLMKSVGIDELKSDSRKVIMHDDQLYVNELLLNKLMEYAYQVGKLQIDETSFSKGWDDAWDEVAKRLGLPTEDELNESDRNR